MGERIALKFTLVEIFVHDECFAGDLARTNHDLTGRCSEDVAPDLTAKFR